MPTHDDRDVVNQPPVVQQYRQLLLWPLQLTPDPGVGHARPWQRLAQGGPWQEVVDEVAGGVDMLAERHYSEFVAFLPYVQRFLYGEGRRSTGAAEAPDGDDLDSPMRVFRRSDVAAARVVTEPGEAPLVLTVRHVDLHFFYDLDIVLLNVEVWADHLTLRQAQALMYRLGRGYPGGWQPDGTALHSLEALQWLDSAGQVLASSDMRERDDYLRFVAGHRAPRIAAHWAWLLQPLVSDPSPASGPLRYRQIEYYRMPTMAWLALDDPLRLTRADFVRLGLVTGEPSAAEPRADGQPAPLPYAEAHLADFEARHCYDRFWLAEGAAPHTRYLCSGHALVVVGRADSAFYTCGERGVLAQFRHQHAMLFLIAHVQKAALLMFSDRLVDALKRLHIDDAESVKRFKRSIRRSFEGFLRFTHRYWFHEISDQAQVKALFDMTTTQLGLDRLYDEVRQRTADMNDYLDADSLRRQANTVVRLTVVTIVGLVGTISTGFLGMNVFNLADAPAPARALLFVLVLLASLGLTVFAILRSKRLSDWLDALSDERLPARQKWRPLLAALRQRRP
jgi:CorA-like Mg2+ transporter protein